MQCVTQSVVGSCSNWIYQAPYEVIKIRMFEYCKMVIAEFQNNTSLGDELPWGSTTTGVEPRFNYDSLIMIRSIPQGSTYHWVQDPESMRIQTLIIDIQYWYVSYY